MSLPPFSHAEIEERLDDLFVEADTSVIEYLAGFDIRTQDRLLDLVARAAATNSGLAYQFGGRLPRANEIMATDTLDRWLDQAIDAFDSKGLHHAIGKLDELETMARHARDKLTGVAFEEVCILLEHFVTGLDGRKLNIDFDTETFTDTETLYLPAMVNRFRDRQDNFGLYKCIAVHLWAQTRFGTWRVDPESLFADYPDRAKALRWFHALECVRLDACIERELPGLHREMVHLAQRAERLPPARWDIPGKSPLLEKQADARTTLELLPRVYGREAPKALHYQGSLQPQRVAQVRDARIAREKDLFRRTLAALFKEKNAKPGDRPGDEEKAAWKMHRVPAPDLPDGFTARLELDGEAVPMTDDLRALANSIVQDLGDIPDDYLAPAGDGDYRYGEDDKKREARDVWQGTYHEEGAWLYREWDYRRRRYKKNWCALRELDVPPVHDDFAAATLAKYSGLVKNIRRGFEILRGENRMLRKQTDGDDIDIDALGPVHTNPIGSAGTIFLSSKAE